MQQLNSQPKTVGDGHSWLINYACVLMSTFRQFSEEYVYDELPMARGWVYFQWAKDNDPVAKIFGGPLQGKRFIAQEVDRLVSEAVALEPRWKME